MLRPNRPGSAVGDNKELFAENWKKMTTRFESGDVGFFRAPTENTFSQLEESITLAEQILAKGVFTDCLFIGIGGSSLGPISLLSALKHKVSKNIAIHFMENPDPMDWKDCIAKLNPHSTLVCVVTKSGTTFETISLFLLALQWLGKERWKSHVVAITDPEKGDLRAFVKTHGLQSLSIAPSMGGRFSIFTPVGLFPAALAGLSARDFLLGAKQIRDYVDKAPPEKNPLFILSNDLILNFPKRSIHVCMPYSTQLKQLSSWFVQLWGESLGKDGKGFTPLAAIGTNDQHSILQLLRDGPDDKVTTFITVDHVDDAVEIPRTARLTNDWTAPSLPSFALLEGHTLQDLLRIEYRAISLVLTKRSRPHFTIQMDRLDERALGSLYFAYSVMTAFSGALWNVNPFDQPGVEEGKIYIRDSLNEQRSIKSQQAAEDNGNSPVDRLRRPPRTDFDENP